MNFECLQSVLAVYRTRIFSKAALELFLSQSSVSKNVAKAEDELQVKLFDRSGSSVVPTPGGSQLIPLIEDIADRYEMLKSTAFRYSEKGGETFTISTTPLISGHLLTNLFQQCAAEFPSTKMHILENTNRKSILALENGEADLAVTVQTYVNDEPCGPFSISSDPKFLLQPLFRDEYCAVVPPNHPFAALDCVELEQFQNEDFIAVDETFASYHAMIARVFSLVNIRPQIVFSASAFATVLDMVASGRGISILTKRIVPLRDDVVLVPLSPHPYRLCRETALVCINRKPLPRILKWMMNYARSTCSKPESGIPSAE